VLWCAIRVRVHERSETTSSARHASHFQQVVAQVAHITHLLYQTTSQNNLVWSHTASTRQGRSVATKCCLCHGCGTLRPHKF